ncbi:hypothetical protein [Pseudomonas sp.]|uniref:hypothetical protein n=1 Tax=Pseudomonas sp. TaxID=306 RepID=UPI0028A8FC90|nr:hypothetical protein [Pseudomonas sp.]
MLLAKSCKAEHHIKNGTIKVGTLYEYRNIENSELVDKQEGMLSFHLNFAGSVEVPILWFATINQGIFGFGDVEPVRFPGKQNAYFEHVAVQRRGDKVILTDSTAVFSRESLNGFIFCVSRVRKTQDCVGIFQGCDAYWYITEARAQAFGVTLSKMLMNYVQKAHAEGEYILPQDTDMSTLKIHIEHRAVEYLGREVVFTNDGDLPLESFMTKMTNMAFTKPESYKKELEYRFCFTFVSGNRIIEPLVKSVYLDSTPLIELIF